MKMRVIDECLAEIQTIGLHDAVCCFQWKEEVYIYNNVFPSVIVISNDYRKKFLKEYIHEFYPDFRKHIHLKIDAVIYM